jgi:hypothetical protein
VPRGGPVRECRTESDEKLVSSFDELLQGRRSIGQEVRDEDGVGVFHHGENRARGIGTAQMSEPHVSTLPGGGHDQPGGVRQIAARSLVAHMLWL